MRQDLAAQAQRLVSLRFPHALGAVLGGSAATGRATATSDLDLVVLVGEDTGTTYRETIRFEGRVAELFVHTPTALAELFAAGRADRRGVLQRVYAEGAVLVDAEGHATRARASAETELAAGPPPLGPGERESLRYGLTEALDDLADNTDPDERAAIATVLLRQAADLLFDHHRAWSGAGKWLPRRLLAASPTLGAALLSGHRTAVEDPAALLHAGGRVLARTGGTLREGFRREWPGSRQG
ncbi:nucleotidyltransferase domain-containing protein [Kitasatospora sp. NBC_01287]|uniref:nucleotidyltransferase domain-containing protein n=1 Tax=Kitasatospora sp. NBC_01287 TaxID=2903573 RepID=UPI00225012B6|nr:nucleotidyltransferase domain-containing protein [Kitasatospora sp. NBC_01287]MCX4750694.1 nucleotidyltransferase domain-containing protein [Kitasatospora sp. NBC_01287]